MERKSDLNVVRIALTGVFMAMNIISSSFGIPVPGGHLYLCDTVICLAAILLNPFEAFVVGGLGSYIGDLIFYPLPRHVSLAVHGLQAVVISLIVHKLLKHKPRLASGIAVFIGGIIMVVGYTLGKTFVYSTFEYAMIKLPYEIAQAVLGAVMGMILCWKTPIRERFLKITGENANTTDLRGTEKCLKN
ncbi:MAG: ECF transporter S component [Lachnospiraceae bacterium]|nr:ECF transporter S component [Lachnospiraceae bacterium]